LTKNIINSQYPYCKISCVFFANCGKVISTKAATIVIDSFTLISKFILMVDSVVGYAVIRAPTSKIITQIKLCFPGQDEFFTTSAAVCFAAKEG
jgi:hypothetical protein